jgi:4-hydroxybenzoate polyprenyltransferase
VGGAAIATLYPFMKRWTYLPQIVLGAAFSWGIVMAFAATGAGLGDPAWLMFIASVLWIVSYDTLYAMVDRDDDVRVGIKSTAILFGNADRAMVAALQAGSVAAMILPAGFISSTVPELSLFDLPFLLPGAPAQITAFAAQITTVPGIGLCTASTKNAQQTYPKCIARLRPRSAGIARAPGGLCPT